MHGRFLEWDHVSVIFPYLAKHIAGFHNIKYENKYGQTLERKIISFINKDIRVSLSHFLHIMAPLTMNLSLDLCQGFE